MSLRSGPGGARSDPRGPKTAPRDTKSAPRGAQEPPKRRNKKTKKYHYVRLGSRGASGRPPGAILEGFWARFWVLRAPFWSDSGTIVGSILKRVEVDFQTCWGQSSLLSLLVEFDMFVLFCSWRCSSHVFSAFPGIEPESSEKTLEKLTTRSSSKRPASARRRAPGASQEAPGGPK